MLLMATVSILSLEHIASTFSLTTQKMAQISFDVRKIWNIEQKIGDTVRMVHEYVRTDDDHFRNIYWKFHDSVVQMLREMNDMDLGKREVKAVSALINDFNTIEGDAAQIFALHLDLPADRARAKSLLGDLDNLLAWMQHDIELYKEDNTAKLDALAQDIRGTRTRINLLFGANLLAMALFLFALGIYVYRKVSVPLGQLWNGAEEFSRGNLNFRVQVRGEADIARLGERFNEMARKLRESYTDLERRLLERTQQLGALNSVALTLGQAGTLREVLKRSLTTTLRNFPELEPRGGIFLCEPDGESLRLVAHQGLSQAFAMQEERILMGECLCGMVAQTGELHVSGQGCIDPRHTRGPGGHDHGHIILPIKARGIVLGVMFLYPQNHFTLNPSDIQLFDSIGSQLGMAVENLRFYREVKESSEKYWDLFENSRDILFTMDLEGKVTAANRAAAQFLARPKTELIGMNVLEILTDEGRALASRILRGLEPLEEKIFEFEVRKDDGSRAFLEISGRSIYWMNKPVGFQVAGRDVTEQKNLRELLVKAERLAAIGQVGIAMRHEINNPLTTIIGNIELLLDRLGGAEDDEETKRRLEMALDNALRISEIMKRLQALKEERTIEYLKGVKMTDLTGGEGRE